MYQNLTYIWNNIQSTEIGLSLVKIQIESTHENFASSRSINAEQLLTDNYNYRNYFYQATPEPMKFTIELVSEEILTDERIDELAQIFILPYYVDFVTTNNMRVYNCISTSSSLNVYGNGYYISLEMICSSPFSTSQFYTETFTNPTSFILNNMGSIPMYLYMEITPKTTGGTIRIMNTTNSGYFIELKTDSDGNQLIANEVIEIDMQKNRIKTNQIGLYRYSNLNPDSTWFQIVRGINNLTVSGSCDIKVYYKYYYMT